MLFLLDPEIHCVGLPRVRFSSHSFVFVKKIGGLSISLRDEELWNLFEVKVNNKVISFVGS